MLTINRQTCKRILCAPPPVLAHPFTKFVEIKYQVSQFQCRPQVPLELKNQHGHWFQCAGCRRVEITEKNTYNTQKCGQIRQLSTRGYSSNTSDCRAACCFHGAHLILYDVTLNPYPQGRFPKFLMPGYIWPQWIYAVALMNSNTKQRQERCFPVFLEKHVT